MKPSILLARQFTHFAQEFYDASARLAQSKPFLSHPTFYLAVHALELALKAHLARDGAAKRFLSSKALGHSLKGLLREANDRGIASSLGLDSHDQRNISMGSKHYEGKCFEYPELFHSTFPIGIWLRWAKKAIDALPIELQ